MLRNGFAICIIKFFAWLFTTCSIVGVGGGPEAPVNPLLSTNRDESHKAVGGFLAISISTHVFLLF
jgi:hypothetical protein